MEYYYVLEVEAKLVNVESELKMMHTVVEKFTLQPVSKNHIAFLDLISNRAWFRLHINNLPIGVASKDKEKQFLFHFSVNSGCRIEEKNGYFYIGFLFEEEIENLVDALTRTLSDFGYV